MTQELEVPLFPLPQLVLFPSVQRQFYIFEPRYRALLADTLDGAGWIGMPQVLPGFEGNAAGSPPVTQVFGVGRLMDYQTRTDGTSDVEIAGIFRVRMIEELPERIYRRARVEVLDDPDAKEEEVPELRRRICRAVEDILPLGIRPEGRDQIHRLIVDEERGLGPVVNTLATVLVQDPRTQQSLLESKGIALRCRRLVTEIEDLYRLLLRERSEGDEVDDDCPPDTLS